MSIIKKIIRKVKRVSQPVRDIENGKLYVPIRWELFGFVIKSSYEELSPDEQSQYLGII